MRNKLTRNWGLKLGSFLFAAVLWLIVTNVNDPIGTYRVYNVPVNIQNTDLITNNGRVYEVLDNTDVIDVVTISAKRSIIDSLNESNVVAVADVNDLTSVNTINIKLSTNKYNDKLESIRGNIDSVRLNIENEKTKTLPLRTETRGTVKEGFMVGDITTEQNLVAISGPESVVEQVKRAVAAVDVSGFTSNIGTDSEVRLYDENDKVINADSLVKNISKVRVTVEILELKTVPVSWSVMGTPARGYEATGDIIASRNNVVIAGKSNVIENISAIEIPETVLDITGATESLETIVNLNDYLPNGIRLAEENFKGRVSVEVPIEAVIERRVEMPVNAIQILNMPEGFEYEFAGEGNTYYITLVGLERDLNALDTQTIQATADMAQYAEEMTAGDYTVELAFNLDAGISLKDTVSIGINIAEIEE